MIFTVTFVFIHDAEWQWEALEDRVAGSDSLPRVCKSSLIQSLPHLKRRLIVKVKFSKTDFSYDYQELVAQYPSQKHRIKNLDSR